ncbi:hypothetical protein G6F62_015598 [Rhizopus arrhizus]|nr:hypothetical protein G6F62_015598 [Rhizopus arrhizus]
MTSIRNEKTVKSKNSNALPIVVPAITRRRMDGEYSPWPLAVGIVTVDMLLPLLRCATAGPRSPWMAPAA